MIVAVVGGKGGVGKTTTALNLARELEAVVVDADLTTPDLPRGRGPDLHDVLAGRTNPLEAVETIGEHQVLPCGRTLEGARAADLTELPAVLEFLDRQYGTVVVDCPAGLARDVGVALHATDVAVMVTRPEKPALVNAYRTRSFALEVDTPIACVALNRARPSAHEEVADRVESAFGAPTRMIPTSDRLADAQADHEALRDVAPESEPREVFQWIARTVEQSREHAAPGGSEA